MKKTISAEALFEIARKTAEKAYAPYSNFRVGAALLLENETVIQGINVENRSFGLTNCAERTALFTALSQGETSFKAIAVASPDTKNALAPCGACRQVISEFCSPDMPIYFDNGKGGFITSSVKDLLPADSLQGELQQ